MSNQNDLDTQLVYVKSSVNNRYDIFLYDFNSNSATNLTASLQTVVANFHPSWSPDGQQIAWSAKHDQGWNHQLWIMDAEGQNAHHIEAEGDIEIPKWSPDGSKIAYTTGGKVHLYDLKTGITTRLEQTTASNNFLWSPDSQSVAYIAAFEDYFHLTIASIDNDAVQRIAKGDFNDLIWAPNNTFYFAGGGAWEQHGFALSSLSPDGQLKSLMPLDALQHSILTISPDGKRIAYFTFIGLPLNAIADYPDHKGSLHITDSDGQNHREILHEAIPGRIRWSPNQTKLAWGTNMTRRIYMADLMSRKTRLIADGGSGDFAWRP